jgi:divalent metal cation (Fe/Co/Zn/Cd) transporter
MDREDKTTLAILIVVLFVVFSGAVVAQSAINRLLNQSAVRVCRVEAMNQNATVIVKLDQPQPCDPASMAIEAREAVKAALDAE